MKLVNIIREKYKKKILSKKIIFVLNNSLLKKIRDKIIINIILIFISIFPAIKLNGNKANIKLKTLPLSKFTLVNKYIFMKL